ncbi:MAG: hypothetical protein ACK6CU_06340 [Deltaproteobacteria bacterium]|jgi:hypothetical protein
MTPLRHATLALALVTLPLHFGGCAQGDAPMRDAGADGVDAAPGADALLLPDADRSGMDGGEVADSGGPNADADGMDAGAPAADGAISTADAASPAEDGGSDAAPDTGPAAPPWIVAPTAGCAPSGAACGLPAPEATTLFASYRKDAWLPEYAETGSGEPRSGGRVQIAAVSAATGRVSRVRVNGVDLSSIESPPASGATPPFEWYHVWPRDVVAGEPVWVAFHSRDGAWDRRSSAELVVETSGGDAVRGSFPVAITPAPVTYVTTTEDRSTVIVHAVNRDTVPHTLERLLVDGRDATAAACIPSRTVQPGETVMWTVPRCAPSEPGDAWTVVLDWRDANDAVGVGRVIRPRFPIEAWNNTRDCPIPGGDADALRMHREARIDTLYIHAGVCSACGRCDTATLLGETLPGIGLHAIATDDLSDLSFASTAGLAAFSTGDESDGEIYEGDGRPRPALRAASSRRAWERHPEVPTFNGAKTNRNVGTFAGMADIQGIDFYVAACAPHITPWGTHPPLRAPYDYLRNARENHMPGTTWLYTQGLSPVWNRRLPIGGLEIPVQPTANEIYAQAFESIAAGSKGLMWFQSNIPEGMRSAPRWAAITNVNRMVGSVRELLRTGDPIGARSTGSALVEALRSQDAIVVPVVSLSTSAGPSDVGCGTVLSEGSVPRWSWSDSTVELTVPIPRDFGVLELFEITPEGVRDAAGVSSRVADRDLVLSGVTLPSRLPVRLFVLARTAGVRTAAAAAF